MKHPKLGLKHLITAMEIHPKPLQVADGFVEVVQTENDLGRWTTLRWVEKENDTRRNS